MSGHAILTVLLFAAEAAAASIVLPVCAWSLARTYRRSASRRRLAWAMMFAVLLALPLLAAVSPSLTVISLYATPAHVPTAAAAEPAGPLVSTTTLALFGGLLAWLCGALVILARGLSGLVHLERLRRGSTPVQPEHLPLPLPHGCAVRVSPDCPGPMTWGAVRPLILLPDGALDWPRARLESALRHELAHVRRRDSLVQALTLAACALYWPNPLVWRAARALRDASEAAADDAVIASGVRPSDYAAQLVDLAREWSSRRGPAPGLAMAAPPILTERVQSILSPDASRTGATPMDIFKLALVGGVAAAGLTLARPSVAEVPAAPSAADPQTQQAAPAAPPANAAPSAPAGATIRYRVHDQVAPNIQGSGDKRTTDQAIQLAQQDVPAPPAAAAAPAAATPPAPLAPRPGWGAPVWIPGPAPGSAAGMPGPMVVEAQQVPYNPVTDDPASPGYIAPGQPGAQHPVPAGLAKLLNARAAPNAPWTLSWLPNSNGALPPGARASAGAGMTPEQQAELNRKLAEIGPKISKALADAHISEQVAKSLAAAAPHVDAALEKQLAEINVAVQKALADARISEQLAKSLDAAKPQVDATVAETLKRVARDRAAHEQQPPTPAAAN